MATKSILGLQSNSKNCQINRNIKIIKTCKQRVAAKLYKNSQLHHSYRKTLFIKKLQTPRHIESNTPLVIMVMKAKNNKS